MKCPYTIHRRSVVQETYEYNDEGVQTATIRIENNTSKMVECEKENCGAWQDGKCHYAGSE